MNQSELGTMSVSKSREGRLVWAAKFYSGVRGDSLWLVVGCHPGHAKAEDRLLQARETLRLRRRGRTAWKVWPNPFNPPDDCELYQV